MLRILIALFLSLSLPLAEANDSQKPNVLFLLSDDQAWNDYGFMGHPHIETPVIDQLAKDSLTFTRGYTPVPLCRPSLASITTGLHPHQHGITGNDPFFPVAGIAKPSRHQRNVDLVQLWNQSPNMLQALKQAGYRTLQTGKWWEGNPVSDGGFTHGMSHGDPKRGGRHGDLGLQIGRDTQQPIYDFINDAGEQPWFIWYGVFLPHTPHDPPKALLDKYLKVAPTEAVARYWANCERLDQSIGHLLDFLKGNGQLDNTLIVYTCDNGWIQHPEHPERYGDRSKQTIHEGGIRTPILLSWNGHISPQMNTENLASNLDLWPTIATLTATACPENLPGIDLTDPHRVQQRKAIFGASFNHNIRALGKPANDLKDRFIIGGDWKLITHHASGAGPELYNLKKDPWEKLDIAAQEREITASLLTQLNQWWNP